MWRDWRPPPHRTNPTMPDEQRGALGDLVAWICVALAGLLMGLLAARQIWMWSR